MKTTPYQSNASATTTAQYSTRLEFSEYHGQQHIYDGAILESCRGSREAVITYLRLLVSLVPADEESLRWSGRNGTWYSGDEARAVIMGEILNPYCDEAQPDAMVHISLPKRPPSSFLTREQILEARRKGNTL